MVSQARSTLEGKPPSVFKAALEVSFCHTLATCFRGNSGQAGRSMRCSRSRQRLRQLLILSSSMTTPRLKSGVAAASAVTVGAAGVAAKRPPAVATTTARRKNLT